MATNPKLGKEIHQLLESKHLETPMIDTAVRHHSSPAAAIANSHRDIMTSLRLNLDDDSLQDTPQRVAKMYTEELFYGLDYDNFPNATAFDNPGYNQMLATNCTVQSFCEHHFLPFIGTAHVAYIPGDKFLGLSKFSRIVDFFARRPQVQERLTCQIWEALAYILKTEDVAVYIEAEHYCAKIRGVKEPCGMTVTSQVRGKFFTEPTLRNEFMMLTRK